MIDKELARRRLAHYGEMFCELKQVIEARSNGEKRNPEDYRLETTPKNLYIEPTNNCNKNCKYCARTVSTRSITSIDFEVAKRIIDRVPEGVNLTLTGNGEPLLHKRIYDLIAYAVEKGHFVSLITNASSLTEPNARKLLRTGLQNIKISFDSVSRAAYDDSYNSPTGGVSFDQVLFKILRLLYLSRIEMNIPLYVTVSSILTEEVKRVRSLNQSFWKQLPIDNYYDGPVYSLQTDSLQYEPTDYSKKENWKICSWPFIALKVNSDGSTNICGHDFSSRYSLGNVNDMPIDQIYNSEKALRLRKALYEKDLDFLASIGYNCHRCNYWTSHIGGSLEEFLYDRFPISETVFLAASAISRTYPQRQLERLEEYYHDFPSLLEKLQTAQSNEDAESENHFQPELLEALEE